MLSWAMRPLTLLESIAEVSDLQVTKTGKLTDFFLSSLSVSHASTIMAEVIAMSEKKSKSPSIALTDNHHRLISLFFFLYIQTHHSRCNGGGGNKQHSLQHTIIH